MNITINGHSYVTDRRNVTLVHYNDGSLLGTVWITGVGQFTVNQAELGLIQEAIDTDVAYDLKVYDEMMGTLEGMLRGNSVDIERMIDKKLGHINEALEKIPAKMDSVCQEIDQAADSICYSVNDLLP